MDPQQRLITDLQRSLARSPANVLLIVGAGVTMGALDSPLLEHASWSGLLHEGLARWQATAGASAEEIAGCHELLGSDDPDAWVAVAEAISTGLRGPEGGEFRRWLGETVGAFAEASRETEVLGAIRVLSERGVALATVNYDGVLERATGLPPVTWRQRSRVEAVLRGDEPGILHLHGYWEDPASIVLGARSYEEVVGDEHARVVLRALRLMRTFVLVGHGAGMRDPNWRPFLRWTQDTFEQSEYRHYRLVLDEEVEGARAEHPSGQRIVPLGYGSTHAHLGPFLASLVPSRAATRPVEDARAARWVILRLNVVQPDYERVEESELRELVDGPDPVCLELSYTFERLARLSAREWRAIARGLDALVADAKAVDGPTRFLIAGRAPLPVFAYLGAKMSRMGPSVVANKNNDKWERYPAPDRCPAGGRDDATVTPPSLGFDPGGRLAIAVHSSREYDEQDRSIAELLAAEGVCLAGTYRIQNPKHHGTDPLTPAELPIYLGHVDAALVWRGEKFPQAEGGLVVALGGPAWLAYWTGHRLNPNVARGRIDFPNLGENGYVRALSYPMHTAPWLAGKAKLQLINAEPTDLVRVQGHQNLDRIQGALERELGERGPYEFKVRAAASVRELMRDVETFSPDILHFHLHGRENGELAFEDERGETCAVTAEHFVDMLRATGAQPVLIVLSACDSAILAESLLGIAECVIAVEGKANTEGVIDFSRYFYEALARGNTLARAIEQGVAGSQAKGIVPHTVGGVRAEQIVLFPRLS